MSHMKKLDIFLAMTTPISFSNIAWYRDSASSHLRRKSVDFLSWIISCDLTNFESNFISFLIRYQLFITLHFSLRSASYKIPYTQLPVRYPLFSCHRQENSENTSFPFFGLDFDSSLVGFDDHLALVKPDTDTLLLVGLEGAKERPLDKFP